jgi:hypothetical protein
MTVKAKAQVHMEDQFIEDPELEQLLEDREAAKAKAAEYYALDTKAKSAIIALGPDGKRRCGRFIVSTKATAGRTVDSFETKAGVRVNIKAVSADGA